LCRLCHTQRLCSYTPLLALWSCIIDYLIWSMAFHAPQAALLDLFSLESSSAHYTRATLLDSAGETSV
jgi:hypothetical protein